MFESENEPRLLEALCGYYELRDRGLPVDSATLLARYPDVADRLGEFLSAADCVDSHVIGCDDSDRNGAAPGAPPAVVGDYEIQCELGRGGMGVVYQAWQVSAKRLVALKMMRFEREASLEHLHRFQVEIQAVAALDHPHIVPIFEVGQFQGRPFFTMKLLDGGPLSLRLGEYRNNPAAAARVVFTIGRALEEAHTRGVLHRDIKPQNIVLDGAGQAYLTDFGLAKLRDGDLALTNSTAAIGSPQYMAPEQARGRSRDVTISADVYGLGATLYALLTGRPPFESDSLFELLHLIQSAEPAPPRQFNPAVPADLEVICLKCLRKERSDRYASAGEMADDLQAFLHGLPVRARPVHRLARARLWCRRNPSQTVLGALLTMALVVAMLFWWLAESRLKQVTAERNRAESSYQLSREALDRSVKLINEDPRLREGPLEKLRLAVLAAQLEFHEKFVRQYGGDPTFSSDLAASHVAMAYLADEIGEREQALSHFRQALGIYEQLSHGAQGLRHFGPKVAECLSHIGRILYDRNRQQEVDEFYIRARRILEYLVAGSEGDDHTPLYLVETLRSLGSIRRGGGRVIEAVELHEQAVATARSVRDRTQSVWSKRSLAASLSELAYSLERSERLKEARRASLEAQGIYAALLNDMPDEVELLFEFAYAHLTLASIESRYDLDAADSEYRNAIGVWKKLVDAHPEVPRYRVRLAEACGYRGDGLRNRRRLTDAVAEYSCALETLDAVGDPGADQMNFRRAAGYARYGLGLALTELQKLDDARQRLEEAIRIYGDLTNDYPQMADAFELQAQAMEGLARLGRSPLEWHERTVACRKKLLALSPGNRAYTEALAAACERLAGALWQAGRRDEAERACRDAIPLYEAVLPESESVERPALKIRIGLAALLRKVRQFDQAERTLRECVALGREHVSADPTDRGARRRLARAIESLGEFLEETGFAAEARAARSEVIQLRHALLADHAARDHADPIAAAREQVESGELELLAGAAERAIAHLDAALSAPRGGETAGADARRLMARAHALRAVALSTLGRHDEALTDRDAALALDPDTPPWMRVARADNLVRLGRVDEAVSALDDVVCLSEVAPNILRWAAAVFAVAARPQASLPERTPDFASRAIELLHRAIEGGYRNVTDIELDPDFAELRSYVEFQNLLSELRSRSTSPGASKDGSDRF